MHPALDQLHEDLHQLGVQLRFRTNRRKILHFSGTEAARHRPRFVVHPLVFDPEPEPIAAALRSYADERDPAALPVLQQAVDRVGLRLAEGGEEGGCSPWLPLYADDQRVRIHQLMAACRQHDLQVTPVDTERVLLTVDHRRARLARLHYRLLDLPDIFNDLLRYLHQAGRRGPYARLDLAIAGIFGDIQRFAGHLGEELDPSELVGASLSEFEPIGPEFDPVAELEILRQRYFPDCDRPQFCWARNPGDRPLRSIRYGSYRSRPRPEIRLHPRLAQPWVASVFVRHVLHHELCHHAQACRPVRGETPHSRRFRAWEARFEDFHRACSWERRFQAALLGPPVTVPA